MLTVGTNSYIDAAQADAYFADRLRADAWTNATPDQKDDALVTAAAFIDRQAFKGAITSETQALAWPRAGVHDQEGRAVNQSTVPQAVKDAQAEMALALLKEDLTEDDGSKGVRRLRAGSVEVEYAGAAPARKLPDIVRAILVPFLTDAGEGSSVKLVP